MKPLNNYIVVEINKERKKIAGDFQLSSTETNNHRYQRATVVAVSDMVEPYLKPGNNIFYHKGRDFTLPIKGEEKTIIRFEEVVMIDD
jgi:co-chaperonin GroES (HSP10)